VKSIARFKTDGCGPATPANALRVKTGEAIWQAVPLAQNPLFLNVFTL
jgi:hypothetical protein